MTRIHLVRHGDTAYNREAVFRGTLDVPLDDTGREQARLTGLELAGERIGRIVSSPLSRALDTARAIAAHQPAASELEIDPAFNDLDFGQWQGMAKDDVAAQFPELFDLWLNEPNRCGFPGGETLEAASARAAGGLRRIIDESAVQTIAVASHRVIIKLLILHALGLPLAAFWRVHVDTCGITTFAHDPAADTFILLRHNHTAHLAPLREKMTSHDF